MERRLFLTRAMMTVLSQFAICSTALGQWPGEEPTEPAKTDTGSGWPVDSDGHYIPDNADKFICTFSFATQQHALKQLGATLGGRVICPQGDFNAGDYHSNGHYETLKALIKKAGVRKDRIIAKELYGFQNAAAILCEDYDGKIKQVVMWDPLFFEEVNRKAGTPWASIAILAHELAHHLNNDTGQNPGRIPSHEKREQELYADRYAGQVLRQLGASRQEAVAVFYQMGEGGETHPPPWLRVAAAGEGWDSSDSQATLPSGNAPELEKASACVTSLGYCELEFKTPSTPIGSICYCPTSYGPIAGIAQ